MKTDKFGNQILEPGDLTVTPVDLSEYGVIHHIHESSTTESVYVVYCYGDKIAKVRYSNHHSNSVACGEVISGDDPALKGKVLHKLGLAEEILMPVEEIKTFPCRNVKKSDLHLYDVADITEEDFRRLPVGADIRRYQGKVLKNSSFLVTGTKIELKHVRYLTIYKPKKI